MWVINFRVSYEQFPNHLKTLPYSPFGELGKLSGIFGDDKKLFELFLVKATLQQSANLRLTGKLGNRSTLLL